jgi:hypothetical protein
MIPRPDATTWPIVTSVVAVDGARTPVAGHGGASDRASEFVTPEIGLMRKECTRQAYYDASLRDYLIARECRAHLFLYAIPNVAAETPARSRDR